MSWEFSLPVKIYFGTDKIQELPKIISEYGYKRGVLVCSNTLKKNGTAEEVVKMVQLTIITVGTLKENYLKEAINEYKKRFSEWEIEEYYNL